MDIRKGVIIGTLSTVISGIFLMIISFIMENNPFTLFKSIFSKISNFVTIELTLPLWGFVLIALAPIIILSIIVFILSKKEDAPAFLSYVSDTIFSIYWTWEYSGSSINKDKLLPLCPECKRALTDINKWVNSVGINKYSLGCPNCDFKSDTFEEDTYGLQKKVLTEISGRIRNNEYKKQK